MQDDHKYTASKTDIEKAKKQAKRSELTNENNKSFEQIAKSTGGRETDINSNPDVASMKDHSEQAKNSVNRGAEIIGKKNQLR